MGFCVGSEVYFGQSCTLFFVWLCGFSVRDLSYPPCKKVEDRFGATWPGEPPPRSGEPKEIDGKAQLWSVNQCIPTVGKLQNEAPDQVLSFLSSPTYKGWLCFLKTLERGQLVQRKR